MPVCKADPADYQMSRECTAGRHDDCDGPAAPELAQYHCTCDCHEDAWAEHAARTEYETWAAGEAARQEEPC